MTDTDLEERFGTVFEGVLDPRYNAAPSQNLPVIRTDSPERVSLVRWGLIPRWADDRRTQFINARAETLREKRSFADSFEQRRCLVLANGFYEWTEKDGRKQPYRVTLTDEKPFCTAGVFERWTPTETQSDLGAFANGENGRSEPDTIETFAIVTTEANGVVEALHDRMPVVLPREAERRWLSENSDDAADLLRPYAGEMDAYPVSRAVNDPSNDAPELIAEVELAG